VVRIGLVSDSCGHAPLLARALAALDHAGAERLFFLGCRWADADAALAPPFPVAVAARLRSRLVRVGSASCPERASGEAPAKLIEMVGGSLAYLVHDKADLARDEIANATFLLHGAADVPALVRIGPRFFVTPGRLAGVPAGTFALLELDGSRVELVVFDVDGRERTRLTEQAVPIAQVKVR
jgi:hypothetical protein